jgi:hypothetical protein
MGTRGTYGFREDGTDKLTYNHFDSYPSGLGDTIVKFINCTTDEQLRAIATEMVMVDEETPASPDQIEQCKEYFDGSVGTRQITDWYGLLRAAQGEPMEYVKGLRFMVDNHSFTKDSLFCEYGYIVNIDEGVLEFYKGFNKNPDADGRYARLTEDEVHDMGYVGIELMKTYTFDEIRNGDLTAIVAEMEKLCCDEEDEEQAV